MQEVKEPNLVRQPQVAPPFAASLVQRSSMVQRILKEIRRTRVAGSQLVCRQYIATKPAAVSSGNPSRRQSALAISSRRSTRTLVTWISPKTLTRSPRLSPRPARDLG